MNISDHIKKVFFMVIGVIALVLGVIGLLLPVMPTVPFLLLASYCFIRSSEKFYNWLIHHPVLGKYIKSYMEERSITKMTKVYGVASVWFSLGITIYVVPWLVLKISLGIVGIALSIYILSLKTTQKLH